MQNVNLSRIRKGDIYNDQIMYEILRVMVLILILGGVVAGFRVGLFGDTVHFRTNYELRKIDEKDYFGNEFICSLSFSRIGK